MQRLLTAGVLLLFAACAASPPVAPPPKTPAHGPFQRVAFLLGEWEGREDTSIGQGRGTRVTEMVMGGAYLRSRNRSEFAPGPRRPEGEVHEDWELWSYDQAAGGFVIRQFNGEGFVNHFVQQPGDEPGVLHFETTASENAPPGLRATLTFRRIGPDALHETFKIFWPGRDTPTVFENRWRRTSSPP